MLELRLKRGAAWVGAACAALVASAALLGPAPASAQGDALYRETTVAMTGSWVQVIAQAPVATKIILADNAGAGCSWSFNASPVTNEGVPFSLSGSPGSYVFDTPVPTNAVYVKCPSGTVLTVVYA